MSFVVTPASAAAETEALLTEWALKISVSMPDLVNVVFNHLAMVDEVTGWYGCIVAMRSWVCFSSLDRLGAVLPSYALSVATGHNDSLSGNFGKKNSASFLFCLDCLASLVAKKVTPSGLYCLNLISRFARSADLEGLVSASSIVVLHVNACTDMLSLVPKDFR